MGTCDAVWSELFDSISLASYTCYKRGKNIYKIFDALCSNRRKNEW